ncbi:hypothetical protein FAIPA1_550008 [Frankia sp. AiPs1]
MGRPRAGRTGTIPLRDLHRRCTERRPGRHRWGQCRRGRLVRHRACGHQGVSQRRVPDGIHRLVPDGPAAALQPRAPCSAGLGPRPLHGDRVHLRGPRLSTRRRVRPQRVRQRERRAVPRRYPRASVPDRLGLPDRPQRRRLLRHRQRRRVRQRLAVHHQRPRPRRAGPPGAGVRSPPLDGRLPAVPRRHLRRRLRPRRHRPRSLSRVVRGFGGARPRSLSWVVRGLDGTVRAPCSLSWGCLTPRWFRPCSVRVLPVGPCFGGSVRVLGVGGCVPAVPWALPEADSRPLIGWLPLASARRRASRCPIVRNVPFRWTRSLAGPAGDPVGLPGAARRSPSTEATLANFTFSDG